VVEAAHQTNADLISVEGLDDVFAEIVEGTPEVIPEGAPIPEQESPQAIPIQSKDMPQGIPVEEAAKIFGTSTKAIIKRLQKGTLSGFKVPSKFGNKWQVAPEAIPPLSKGTPRAIPQGIPELTNATPEEIPAQSKDMPQGVPVEIVQELLKKVEALTYRNGYLESQVAERDRQIENHQEQIKLLTDSQHKRGWWARFSSWFMTG
jgi:hypothetical protein